MNNDPVIWISPIEGPLTVSDVSPNGVVPPTPGHIPIGSGIPGTKQAPVVKPNPRQ